MDDYKLVPVYRANSVIAQAIVDLDDYELVSVHTWTLRSDRYAATKIDGVTVLMHRLIVDSVDGDVDHRNGAGLDNRKDNLRPCTHMENMWNRKPNRARNGAPRTSQYKGVWREGNGKRQWRSAIVVNKGKILLGGFETEIEAAKMYDAAARFYFGEFARPNFEGDSILRTEDIRVPIERERKNRTSAYKGVHIDRGKWRAIIYEKGKKYNIGRFDNEIDAARAYDKAARLHFGNFSATNFSD